MAETSPASLSEAPPNPRLQAFVGIPDLTIEARLFSAGCRSPKKKQNKQKQKPTTLSMGWFLSGGGRPLNLQGSEAVAAPHTAHASLGD